MRTDMDGVVLVKITYEVRRVDWGFQLVANKCYYITIPYGLCRTRQLYHLRQAQHEAERNLTPP